MKTSPWIGSGEVVGGFGKSMVSGGVSAINRGWEGRPSDDSVLLGE